MDRRVLVTDADEFVGPACCARFEAAGDQVVAVAGPLESREAVFDLVAQQGPFEVVVANLDLAITAAPITEHTDDVHRDAFDRLVHPLFWIFAACLPAMVEAGDGAVVVPTSATALRTSAHPIAAYESARAAQNALVKSVGWEMAPHGVRVNAIAPNFVENPSYYPPKLVANPKFQEVVRRTVPAQRLGTGDEAAAMVQYLASPDASFLFGAVLPADGGWSLG